MTPDSYTDQTSHTTAINQPSPSNRQSFINKYRILDHLYKTVTSMKQIIRMQSVLDNRAKIQG